MSGAFLLELAASRADALLDKQSQFLSELLMPRPLRTDYAMPLLRSDLEVLRLHFLGKITRLA